MSQRKSPSPAYLAGGDPLGCCSRYDGGNGRLGDRPIGVEDPEAVEHEAERGSEYEADHVAGDVVCKDAAEAEHVVREPEAAEADHHAHDADSEELDALTQDALLALGPEGPVPIAEPVHDDRQQSGHQHGEDRTGVHRRRREDGCPQDVEDGYLDNEADAADKAELHELENKSPESLGHEAKQVDRGHRCSKRKRRMTDYAVVVAKG
ncbi:protein of unknown function [Agreia sp. COWG]|nr:protein of unknown function [Agreia sp. COWG]